MILRALVFLLLATPAFAQPRFEQKHTDLLVAYAAKFGLPALNSDVAREWTHNLAEQFAFTFPSEGWGHKAAGGGRPPSTDVIARNCCGGLWGYDTILSQGLPNQSLISRPDTLNLAGQEFIPVQAFNHIGDTGGGTTPTPQPVPVDLGPITKRIEQLEAQVVALLSRVTALEARDIELSRQHFELSDYAHLEVGNLNTRLDNVGSGVRIPSGCKTGKVLGIGVSCQLLYP